MKYSDTSKVWFHDGTIRPLTHIEVAVTICLPADATLHDVGIQFAAADRSCWAMMTTDQATDLLKALASQLDYQLLRRELLCAGGYCQ
jgi:hypothetical protein